MEWYHLKIFLHTGKLCFGHRSVLAVLCLLFPQLKIENCIIFSDTTCIGRGMLSCEGLAGHPVWIKRCPFPRKAMSSVLSVIINLQLMTHSNVLSKLIIVFKCRSIINFFSGLDLELGETCTCLSQLLQCFIISEYVIVISTITFKK